MKLKITSLLCLLFIGFGTTAQSLDEDPNVVFMKAQVLFDSERYDEAVVMYNQLLAKDKNFARAYMMRAKSKYFLGAPKGTKKDIMEYIVREGVTKEVVKLMSATELELGNLIAAQNYVNTALEMDPYDAEQNKIAGHVLFILKDKTAACEYWETAANLGDLEASSLMKDKCAVIIQMREMQNKEKKAKDLEDTTNESDQEKVVVENNESAEPAENSNESDAPEVIDIVKKEIPAKDRTILVPNPKVQDANKESEEILVNKSEKSKPQFEEPDMDAIQEIDIDEELSVVIGNGLGKRKVEDHPDIFMLSTQEGKVVINICVDGTGKVTSAKIDKKKTTLFKTSLTSLALRKSKEFQFYPSFRDQQCGFLIYMISPGT